MQIRQCESIPKDGNASQNAGAKSKIGVAIIPVQALSVALYLTCLVNKAVEQNQSVGPIEIATYSHIRWGHPMAGLPYPTDHSTVMAVLEGARRKLAKPVQPKEPLTEAALKTICEHYNTNSASGSRVFFALVRYLVSNCQISSLPINSCLIQYLNVRMINIGRGTFQFF